MYRKLISTYLCAFVGSVVVLFKVDPVTGHEGSEGEWRCSPTLSLTSSLVVGGWSTPRPVLFTRGKELVPIV